MDKIIWLLLLVLGILLLAVYRRYYPVGRIRCIQSANVPKHLIKVDLRAYNEVSQDGLKGTLNIPLAYLKRHVFLIPRQSLHVIAKDSVEKNLGIRWLRRYGYNVQSYSLAVCRCQERSHTKKWSTIKKSKTA